MTEISLIPLKEKALNLPDPVRSMILSLDGNTMDAKELIAKFGEWAKLLKIGDASKR